MFTAYFPAENLPWLSPDCFGPRPRSVRKKWGSANDHYRDGAAEPNRTRRDQRLVARRELPVGGTDLPAGQPAADRAASAGARQAAAARALGHHAGAEPDLRASQPGDQELGPGRHLR